MDGIGKKVKEFRIKRGIRQKELSDLSQISKNYISELEGAKKSNMTVFCLCKICKALNVTPNDLIPEKMYKREKSEEEESGTIHSKGSIENTKDKC